MAIGARSQSARTYLEKCIDGLPTCSLDDLIVHALRALRETLPPDQQPGGLTAQNTAIGYLGRDQSFREISNEEEVKLWLDKLPPIAARSVSTAAATDEGSDTGAGASIVASTSGADAGAEIESAITEGTETMQIDQPPSPQP